jgi:DNA topoisomerase-1
LANLPIDDVKKMIEQQVPGAFTKKVAARKTAAKKAATKKGATERK